MTSSVPDSKPLVPVQRVFRKFMTAFLAVNILMALGIAHLTRQTSTSVAEIGPQLARLDAATQYLDRLQYIRIALATASRNVGLAARQDFNSVIEVPFEELQHFAKRLADIEGEKGETFLRHVNELRHIAQASLFSGWRLLESRELLFPSISEMTRHAANLADQIARLGAASLEGWPERLVSAVENAGQKSSIGAMAGAPEKLEEAKEALTALGTLLEEAEEAVRQSGFPSSAMFKNADRPRSRLYRVIMQYHASALRHRETETSFNAIQNEALALARLHRSAAQEAVREARAEAIYDAMMVNIALFLGFCWLMIVLILASEWLKRELLRPMDKLARYMRSIEGGNFWADHGVRSRIDVMRSFVDSAEAFRNAMRQKEARETLLSMEPQPGPRRPDPLPAHPSLLVVAG